MRGSPIMLGLIGCLVLVACGTANSGQSDEGGSRKSSSLVADQRQAITYTSQASREVAFTASAPRRPASCPLPDRVLDGVYHPSRLRVLDPCRRAEGRVAFVRHEEDGDLHIDVALDAPYRNLLARANYSRQHGDLVV